VVWSQFTPGASIIDLKAQNEAQAVQIARVDLSVDPVFAAGRRLYHATDDRRISSDGSSCASCHPEGREDAITWATPDGPRQTIMLAGRVQNTAPFGWIGKHDSLKSYVTGTFTRLGGSGLGQGDPEFDALLAYVEQMPSPAIGDTPDLGPTHEQMLARGKDLFFNEEQGCATCHVGGTTDKVKHDVGSKAKADDVLDFDTPSLRFISGTAPYFHDGRYATLQAMLRATDSKMGHTAQLSQKDVDALEAYLDTL
jgi:mono/diheme cytochrome c family protein